MYKVKVQYLPPEWSEEVSSSIKCIQFNFKSTLFVKREQVDTSVQQYCI